MWIASTHVVYQGQIEESCTIPLIIILHTHAHYLWHVTVIMTTSSILLWNTDLEKVVSECCEELIIMGITRWTIYSV